MTNLLPTTDYSIHSAARRFLRAAVGILAVVVAISVIRGSEPVRAAAPASAPPAKQLPPPTNVTLTTRDGVSLAATFYGSLLGKEAVPVIMLHQFKGSRADFKDLATSLQAKGCAVLVPDLRGHGQSTRQTFPGRGDREINPVLLKQQDFEAMITQDLEACKSYLMDKNNAGELNINKLCVVGAEMGAVLAVDWAAWDWHWPRLATGKQGQDVKALVLISPPWVYKGVSLTEVVNNRRLADQWSWLIIVGDQENGDMREAKRLHQTLEKFFPAPADPAQAADKQAVFFLPLATSLQSAKLLAAKKDAIAAEVSKFLDRRLVKQGNSWTDRKGPL